MGIGLGTSFVATAFALVVQVLVVVAVLALLRPLFMWIFGVNELLAELRALRGDTRQSAQQRQSSNAPAPMFAPEPREHPPSQGGWKVAQENAERAARKSAWPD